MASPSGSNPVSAHVMAHRDRITEAWRQRVLAIPELARLPPAAISDHMPEFLTELATWIGGDHDAAPRAFDKLVQGHALQRLGHGVDLSVLLEEYAILREVILVDLLAVPSDDVLRQALIQLHQALDLAISESLRQFTLRREQLREQFVGILAHDLRNPLQALMMGAESILVNPDCGQPSHARLAAAVRRGGDRMARMIRDLADFARGHLGGGIPAVPQTCDMGDICREAVDELRASHPDRDLRLSAPGQLVGSWDRDRVLQAISNLVANALVHGEDPITVRVFEEPDRQHVVTDVHNRGVAIPPAQLHTLFDPFSRGSKARRGGLGLGLYIVQQIALAHGAACNVTSADDDGTRFTIRWPRTPLSEVPRPYQETVDPRG